MRAAPACATANNSMRPFDGVLRNTLFSKLPQISSFLPGWPRSRLAVFGAAGRFQKRDDSPRQGWVSSTNKIRAMPPRITDLRDATVPCTLAAD
jgi:hypothetical protein